MKRLALGLALLLCGSPAWATSWYFSGCASGGVGTISSPFCLDPGGSGTRKSFEYLMDGAGNEAACGDTIYLCAGSAGDVTDCDGAGSETWHLQPHTGVTGSGTPQVDVDAWLDCTSSPITIQPYCTGGNCETVIISGDADNNGIYLSGTDAAIFFDSYSNTGGISGKTGYVFVGDPNGDFACTPTFTGPGNTPIPTTCTGANLIIEKFANNNFYIAQSWGGVISVTGTEERFGGAGSIGLSPSTTNGYFVAAATGCGTCTGVLGDGGFVANNISAAAIDAVLDSFATFITGGTGNNIDITMQKNYLHHNAQIAFRYNGNCLVSKGGSSDYEACTLGPHLILADQNVIHITHGFGDGHEGRNFTFSQNVVSDFWQGLGIENQMRNINITDNIIACPGDALMGSTQGTAPFSTQGLANFGKCGTAIWVTDNNNAGSHCDDVTVGDRCVTYGVNIARNRIFGQAECTTDGGLACSGPAACKCGDIATTRNYLVGGIIFDSHNVDAAGQNGGLVTTTIENNFIFHTQKSASCDTGSGGAEAPLAVRSVDAVTVRNNTVYDSSCPVTIGDGNTSFGNGGGAGVVAHTFVNNLIVQAKGYGNSGIGNSQEFTLMPNAVTSVVQFNDFHFGTDSSGTGCSGAACIATIGASGLNCANINSGGSPGPTLGLASGASNKCAQPLFSNIAGAKSTWDLHLNSGDTIAKDFGSAFGSCATLDIDSTTRSGNGAACDIGADELIAAAAARRRVVVSTGD